ncbi:MAG: restriction endonuclease subunit S [Bacteroidetes bacterium]|nr:restriction endonuclease subunit S [Bacteroidota bacterium]
MSEWKEYNLDEVYDFASGLSKGAEEFGFGHGFLGFKDVFHNFFVPDELTSLVNSTEKEQQSCSIKRGDVFLTRTSETDEDLGMSCVALKDYPNATFNGFTKRLRPKGNVEILPEYAGFYFRSPKFRATVSGMSSITTRASLNNGMLAQLTISVPPIEEQKAIVDTLFTIHLKIRLLTEQNNLLEKITDVFYTQLINTLDNENWEEISILDFPTLSLIKPGISNFVGEKIYLATADIQERTIVNHKNQITYNQRPSRANMQPIRNSIWFAKMKDSPKFLLIDSFTKQIVEDYILSTGFYGLKIENGLYFIWKFINSNEFSNQKSSNISGSVMEALNNEGLKGIILNIPPNDLILDFESKVEPYYNKISSNNSQIQSLNKMLNSLLPKLMSQEAITEI